jgi:hypothetical protein
VRKLHSLLAALEQGPGTVYELADEARIGVNSCRAMLNELCRQGVISKAGKVTREVTVQRKTALYAARSRPWVRESWPEASMGERIATGKVLLFTYGPTMTVEQFRGQFMPDKMAKTVRNHVARGDLPPLVNGMFDTQQIGEWWEARCTAIAPRAA